MATSNPSSSRKNSEQKEQITSENGYLTPFHKREYSDATRSSFGRWCKNLIQCRFMVLIISFIPAIISFIFVGSLIQSKLNAENEQKKNIAQSQLSQVRATIEMELNKRIFLAKNLAAIAHFEPRISQASFEQYIEKFKIDDPAIRSLQLAPNGVVTYVWPLKGNEKAIGHDLLADETRRKQAEAAIHNRTIWVTRPIKLIQGGKALIARYPIFQQSNERTEIFWGFATVLIDYDRFLNLIDQSLSGFDIAIRDVTSETALEPFLGTRKIFDASHSSSVITLPGNTWQVAIADLIPEHKSVTQNMIPYAVALLIWFGVYSILISPIKLRRLAFQIRRQLIESENSFKNAIESMSDGFVIFDKEDKLIACNSNYLNIYNKSTPVIKPGNSFEQMIRYGFRNQQFKVEDNISEEEFVQHRLKLRNIKKIESEQELSDGRWIKQIERPIRGGGCVGLRVDITDLKRKEIELIEAKRLAEKANKAKSQFLATVSHEVRTPLNVIIGILELLADTDNLNDKQQKLNHTALRSANHLLMLLNEILDISKIEAGKLELELHPFNPVKTIEAVAELSRAQAKEKDLDFIVDIKLPENLWLHGDNNRVKQILLNLLSNAVKFTEKGFVKLNAGFKTINGQYKILEIKVSDSGVGFNEDNKKLLFDAFVQLNNTSTRKHEGTGLGLAITRELISLMGGEIAAEGRVNQGACFTIRIPFEVAEESNVGGKENHALVQFAQATKQILIAEDSLANQIVFGAMLENTPYEISFVENGKEAVSLLKNKHFDLVLMDIFMPEMDGVSATRWIRTELGLEIPIIALTANAMKGDQDRFIAAGMNDYLAKPVSRENLLNKIYQWSEAKVV